MGDRGFTKNDMERIGLFQEMGYATIGDKYKVSPCKYTYSIIIGLLHNHTTTKIANLRLLCLC